MENQVIPNFKEIPVAQNAEYEVQASEGRSLSLLLPLQNYSKRCSQRQMSFLTFHSFFQISFWVAELPSIRRGCSGCSCLCLLEVL